MFIVDKNGPTSEVVLHSASVEIVLRDPKIITIQVEGFNPAGDTRIFELTFTKAELALMTHPNPPT